MAAFIQKLFKTRKPSEATKKPRKETPQAPPQPDTSRTSVRDEQLKALQESPTETTLAELAIQGVTADIRLHAARRLTDADSLQQVQKQAKGRDKSVYQAARQALQAIRDEQTEKDKLTQTITTLITNVRDQAKSEDTKLYKARLEALNQQWEAVENHATAEQAQDFLAAVHKCRERIEVMQAALDDEKRQSEQKQQRDETLALLTTTLDDLKNQSPELLPSQAALDALQKTQENRWLEATRDTPVEKQEQKAYETKMLALRNYLSAVRRISQEKDALQSLGSLPGDGSDTENNAREQAQQLLASISWPEGYPVPAVLEPARKLAGTPKKAEKPKNTGDQERQKALSTELSHTISQLEAALEAKQLKPSKQLLKTTQHQLKSLDHRHAKPFQARVQLLTGQLRELSDWQGFATEPKQITLCEQMEYLAEQPMEPEAKAEHIKALQNEWRELGGSSDRDLWTRFKKASDLAYEPCKAYFSAKSGLKQANLETRQTICNELEVFLDNADWTSIDWKAAEKIHQTARQEWKAAWPVEFRENRQTQKRFDRLLKKLEAALDQERKKNEALKKDIVDKAVALLDHEPLQDAMNQAKSPQTDWKAIGITRHREDRRLWQAFRKACDDIFARRDAQRNEQQQAVAEADEAAELVLRETSQLDQAADTEAVAASVARIRALDTSGQSPAMRERARAEMRRLDTLLADQKLKAGVNRWQAQISARVDGTLPAEDIPGHWAELMAEQGQTDYRELVIRAEILTGTPSPDPDQQFRMEIQVQRLAEGMGSAGQTDDQAKALEKLVAVWCLQASDTNPEASLATRFNNALATLIPG
jgi:hypothetical protein